MRASYPTYKSTSIPWLPEMPEHWDLIGLNLLFRDNKNKNKGMVESQVLSLSYGNIIRKQREENFGLIPESFETYQILEPGYIVMRLTDLQNDKRSLRVGYVKERGIITSAYTGLVPGKIDSKYYYYLLHYLDIRKHFYSLGGGVRQSSDYNEIKKTKVPLPPSSEQTAIANYLDAKTEQINRFIEKKERLIALLKEQKQAVINELLSKNTDNWPLVKLKYILSEVNDRSETGKEELLSLSKYQGVIPKSKLEERAGGADSLIGYKKVYYDTIVVNKMQASNGIIGVSKVEGITSPDYSIYRVKSKEYSPDFIGYMLVQPNMLAEYKRVSTGVMDGYIRLYTDDLFDIKIAIPGKSQQLDVLNKIEQATTQINLTINQVEREVGKVKELKQSLIAEVVTGKIKVVSG